MAKQLVVRLAPVSNVPMIVDANSLNNGRLRAVLNGKDDETEIGIDYFRASAPVEMDYAHKIVQEYAKQRNIPETEFLVRARLPKTNMKPRATNDAHLTVVPNLARRKEDGDELTNMAQALQDAHDKEKGGTKASAENPQGATVKRAEGEKKTKRPYKKKPVAERSAKSKAAYERYVKEISQHIEASPTAMQPAVPGPGVSQDDVDEATLQFALKLAKLLKGVM